MENRKILIAGVIILAALMRLLPHIPNFAPIGALALFSGAHLKGHARFIIPLAAMFISDIFLGFHATIPFVYGSFILIIFLGNFLSKNLTLPKLAATSLISSVLFFMITNFGVWLTSSMYQKNFTGLTYSYIMGLPFFRNTIFGDITYSFILFYGFVFMGKFLEKYSKNLLKSKSD